MVKFYLPQYRKKLFCEYDIQYQMTVSVKCICCFALMQQVTWMYMEKLNYKRFRTGVEALSAQTMLQFIHIIILI
jgi:hypothetical protein